MLVNDTLISVFDSDWNKTITKLRQKGPKFYIFVQTIASFVNTRTRLTFKAHKSL